MQRRLCMMAAVICCMIGCKTDNGVGEALSSFLPPTPGEAARGAFNVYDADVRRNSIALLSNAKFGGEEVYVRVYRIMLGSSDGTPVYDAAPDPDATVRAVATQALGMHGSVDDVVLLVPRLRDDVAIVRWEAAKAMQRFHHESAVDPLMHILLRDEDVDVRQAAAYALGQYPQRRVLEVLVAALDDRDFGVVKEAQQAMQTLTGHDLGTDASEWLTWMSQNSTVLFAQQRQYVWVPYEKRATLLQKAQFWRDREVAQPQVPKGADVDAAG